MGKIFAAGIFEGTYTEVTAVLKSGEISITQEGVVNPNLQAYFDYLNSRSYPVGGTYFPLKNSLLSLYNLLANYFFDSQTEPIVLEGELEQLPYEEGIIY